MSDQKVDSVPDLLEDSGDEDGDDDKMDDWVDDGEYCQKASCLFCDFQCDAATQIFKHCVEKHDFNIIKMKKLHKLDCYDYIKLINFIRLKKPEIQDLKMVHPYNAHPWSDDAYLKSTLPDDPLLYFDIESDLERSLPQLSLTTNNINNSDSNENNNKEDNINTIITISLDAYNTLLSDLHSANERVGLYRAQLEAAINDLNSLKATAKELSLLDIAKRSRKADNRSSTSKLKATQSQCTNDIRPSPIGDNNVDDGKTVASSSSGDVDYDNGNEKVEFDEDDFYFQSYDHYSIHEDMLKDKVRTQSYKDAMMLNPSTFANKIVLDLGCGTSILSMFAAQAGAELVYAVDQSDIIYSAMDIVRENGLDKKINCIKSKIEEASLPKQVDIIISEWMGYFLLFESMLESVIYARDHFLAKGGIVLPSHCNIYLGAFDSEKRWSNKVKYWDDVYGFKMSCLRGTILPEADVDMIEAESVLTDISCVKQLNICTCQSSDMDFDSAFELLALRDGNVHGFFGFFDSIFDLKHRVEFSTGPYNPETHWRQTIFLLPQPIPVVKGEKIDGRIYCKRNRKDHRSLDISIIVRNKKHKFYIH